MPMTEIPKYIGGFEILGSLGQGGMGIVYCVRDHALQRDLAVKLQSGDWKHQPELMQRFMREAQILAKINHPNVVQIYSVGEHQGTPFFAMELLEGSIADAARLKMPSIPQLKRWMLESARGLAAIHEMGVIHRDVKPGNLLLTRATSVEVEHVKVADLGIASTGEQFGARLTQVGAVLGTTGYLAPEAFSQARSLDSRADQYSLGVVFYELLARRSPYQDASDSIAGAGDSTRLNVFASQTLAGADVRAFRPEVDEATAALLSRMLNTDPDQRFPNTQALVHALAQVQDSEVLTQSRDKVSGLDAPIPHMPSPSRDRQPPGKSRPGGRVLALALATIALALLLAGAHWLNSRIAPSVSVASGNSESMSAKAVATQQGPDERQRVAWAKYLVGKYMLSSRAEGEEAWTIDLLDQKAGVLNAKFKRPNQKTVKLSGLVESQVDEIIDGDEWDIYQVRLQGADGSRIEMRIEFSDQETNGEGSYFYKGQRQRFDIYDSEDY